MQRKGFLLSGAAALAGAAVPSAARAQFGHFNQQLTIAINVPLSGDRQGMGQEIASGVQGAIDQANLYAGSYSTLFTMRTFDDMDALAQAMVNVQFAASDATVLAVIGGADGKLLTAALPTYANNQMPLLVPGSTADSVTAQGYRNVWRLPTADSQEGQFYARFLAKRKPQPKFALAVTQDGDYGMDVARAFVDQAKSAGMHVDGYHFPIDKPDYARAAKAILTQSPDYILLCGTTDDMGPLIPALRSGGYAGAFGGTEGFYNQTALQKYPDAFAQGFISTSFPPLDRAPDVLGALTNFRTRYRVTALSAFAYAAAQIVITAARTGATNRLTMMSTLQRPTSYNTLVGSFQFLPTGDPVDPNVYFYTIADGKFKFSAPAHATSFVL
ncbi:MAG TPA: ABC transporter substrate-binding protein [Candidatus Baltobacteraceae bacterium]|nr:ABC transporter substrate-binding protein [Candidatus Baltobacteraceae bacterium]